MQLRRSGLLGPQQESILNLRLRNPAIRALAEGRQPSRSADLMGMDLNGYLNYRGVPVIGAWLWDDALELGIAMEIETAEVREYLLPFNYAVDGLALVSLLLLIVFTWVFVHSRRRLALSEAHLQQAQRIGHMGNWSREPDSRRMCWSDELYRIFGRDPCEFGPTREHFIATLHPGDVERVVGAERELMTGGRRYSIDYRVVHPAGRVRWVHEVAVAERDEQGRVKRLSGVVQDITARKEAEQALRESERRFKAVLDNSPTMIYVKDLQGRYLFANATFARVFGVAAEAVRGRRDEEILLAPVAGILQENDARILNAEGPLETEEVLPVAGGDRTYLAIRFRLTDGEGRCYAIGNIATDITQRIHMERERQQLERRLQQAQKMEAIGQLTGGIAHDFNNILASVLGYATLLYNHLGDPSGRQGHYLQEIIKAGERARDLVKQMLDFSRSGNSRPRPLSLSLVVEHSLKMLRPVLPSTIDMTFDGGGDDVPPVLADEIQIHQVLTNLCINARDAMHGHGRLSLKVHRARIAEGSCASCHQPVAGEFVELAVQDDGCGMPAEQQAKIFDPFFTTKEVGKGTGMGLSVVHGIVHHHGGHLLLDSAPGRGSTFRILLPPCTMEAPDAAPQPVDAHPQVATPARILVVDDEIAVGRFLEALLQEQGYEVAVSHDPREALAHFESDPGAVDLVITDQTMPGMSGEQLAACMRRHRPRLPVILCTGFSETLDEAAARRAGIDAFLYKPIDVERLLARVAELLEQNSKRPTPDGT